MDRGEKFWFGCLIVAMIIVLVILVSTTRVTEGTVVQVRYRNNADNAFVVEFDDGRKVSVFGNTDVSIKAGYNYRITYNGLGYVYKVEKVQ